MRKLLSELTFILKEPELSDIIENFSWAQNHRHNFKYSKLRAVTRSTAIVVLADQYSEVSSLLTASNLNLQKFKSEIGLEAIEHASKFAEVKDVDLDLTFRKALEQYRRNNPEITSITGMNIAAAILSSMLQNPKTGRIYKRFKNNGCDFGKLNNLLVDFEASLVSPVLDSNSTSNSKPVSAPPTQETKTDLSLDGAEHERDLLGRAPIAFVMANLINKIWDKENSNGGHDSAFILHVDAPWGGGKTTFANYIRKILNAKREDFYVEGKSDPYSLFRHLPMDQEKQWPKDYLEKDWITVDFNAWNNQHVTPPWWNFYESIREQCNDSFPFFQKWSFKIREWGWRACRPEFLWTLIVLLLIGLAIATLYCLNIVKINDPFGQAVLLFTGSGSLFAFAKSTIGNTKTLVAQTASSQDVENLGHRDPLQRFRKRFSKSMQGYDKPILVVIDDLDRCDADYLVELFRGLMTIFGSSRVVYLLLGDKNWIEKAFANVYSKMKETDVVERISFGRRFVEKAIQLPFILPKPGEKSQIAFLSHLLSKKPSASEETDLSSISELISEITAASSSAEIRELESTLETNEGYDALNSEMKEMVRQDVRREAAVRRSTVADAEANLSHALERFLKFLPDNPRRVKRILNMVSMYQVTAQMELGIVPDSERWRQLVLWIILVSDYPGVAKKLVVDPDSIGEVFDPDSLEEVFGHEGIEERAKLILNGDSENQVPKLTSGAIRSFVQLTPSI